MPNISPLHMPIALVILAGCGAAATAVAPKPEMPAPRSAISDSALPEGDVSVVATLDGSFVEEPDAGSTPGDRVAGFLPPGLSQEFLRNLDFHTTEQPPFTGTCSDVVSDHALLSAFCASPENADLVWPASGLLVCPVDPLPVNDCNWKTAPSPASESIWDSMESFAEGHLTRVPMRQVSSGNALEQAPFVAYFYSDLYDEEGMPPRYSTDVYFMSEVRDAPDGERIGWLKIRGHSSSWPNIDGATLLFWFPDETEFPELEISRHDLGGWDPIPVFDRSDDEIWMRMTAASEPPIWINLGELEQSYQFRMRLTANSAR